VNTSSAALVEAYRRIAARKADGIPFSNPRLSVDGVGFRDFEGQQVGVLITPWCMNLVVLESEESRADESADPSDREAADVLAEEKRSFRFPGGEYEFVRASLENIPRHHALALFTSVEAFPDMPTARAVAEETLRRMLAPAADDSPAVRSKAGEDALAARPVSRRTLLRRTLLQDE
jgi:[NiFe] hydrogenase assembly HybE family chaperone